MRAWLHGTGMPVMSRSSLRPVSAVAAGLAVPIGLVAMASAVAWMLGDIMPFTFFLAAIVLSAWFRGDPAGLLALLLSLVMINALRGHPPYAYGVSIELLPRFVTFCFSGLLLIWMSAARRRAERAVRAARDELEQRVQERTASLEQAYDNLKSEIGARRRGEQRLARARRRAQQRIMEARFSAQLEERTRLAREIHDTLLQGFTGVSFQLLAAMGRVNDRPAQEAALADVLALAQKTLADARQAVWDMRPPALGGGDFSDALRSTLERGATEHGLAFDFAARGDPHALAQEVETALFRVAHEAVTNVVKHASARTVRVILSYEPRRIRLAILDDGSGFVVDPDLRTYAGHWGLLGMRERASQLRGRLRVRSAPGAGTRIVLVIPTRRHRASAEDAGELLTSAVPVG
ncbi:MAG: two-component histidine kinase [Gemmatimonadetes bacterium]|nr:two-component histidine kinase [Gemmatimonadota bacterium]